MYITCRDSRSPCVVNYKMRLSFGYGFFTLIFIDIYIPSGLVPGLICMMDGNSSNTPTDVKPCPRAEAIRLEVIKLIQQAAAMLLIVLLVTSRLQI